MVLRAFVLAQDLYGELYIEDGLLKIAQLGLDCAESGGGGGQLLKRKHGDGLVVVLVREVLVL
jgi:hypothetical protein